MGFFRFGHGHVFLQVLYLLKIIQVGETTQLTGLAD